MIKARFRDITVEKEGYKVEMIFDCNNNNIQSVEFVPDGSFFGDRERMTIGNYSATTLEKMVEAINEAVSWIEERSDI